MGKHPDSFFKSIPKMYQLMAKRTERAVTTMDLEEHRNLLEGVLEQEKDRFERLYRKLAVEVLAKEKEANESGETNLSPIAMDILEVVGSGEYTKAISLIVKKTTVGIDLPKKFAGYGRLMESGSVSLGVPQMPHLKRMVESLGVAATKIIEYELRTAPANRELDKG